MKRLTKKEIERIARIHSAIVIRNTDMFMFDEATGLHPDDENKVIEYIQRIGAGLAGDEPLNLGSTHDIIKYVKNNK